MKNNTKRLVIGILAHVDSGKTTLSEGMLFRAGEIRKLGRVDHGNAFLDNNQIERDRGITIFSKQAVLPLDNAEFTLLDTPGHIDFSTEMERTLQVLDYAILVISGTDGVQNHTETLWKLLIRYNIPTFIFVNKMDISEFEKEEIISELKERLDDGCVDFEADRNSEEFLESVAMCDEDLMNIFLSGEKVSDADLAQAIFKRNIFPCYFGSALKLEGVDEFLSALEKYTLNFEASDEFGAKIFKISEDEQGKRLTHMKITGGSLKIKTLLADSKGDEWAEKVNQIRIYSGAKYKSVDEAFSGMICAVTGLTHTYPGEGIGAEANSQLPVLEPVLTYRVELPQGIDVHEALTRLRRLEQEDPELHILWNEQLQEIHMQLMGEVQLDILKRIIAERFDMDIEFSRGSIAYKETIAEPVEGVGHYEPLRHYAEVHLLLEPGERGSGLQFATDCSEDVLDRNWQRLILTHLEEKKHIGVLTGSPITDMKITLISGRAHQKHTEGGDFRQATYRAIRHGLKSTESILLEPYYDFKLEVPTENVGRAMTDIQQMGGSFSQPETRGDMSIISGSAPVAAMRDYQVTGYTRGRGRLSCIVKGYEPCHNADEVIEEIGYNSENDLENPADSVFCSHGAGYTVKWDKVTEHMHLESAWQPESEEDEEPKIVERRVREYLDSVAEDKELLRIFESTYGKVDRKPHTALETRKTPQKKYPKARPLPQGPEYLLVDGYNIIFAWDELKKIAEKDLEAARNRLTDILCNYRGYKQCELILVFDAYKVKGNYREIEKINNISVVYTKEAETADMYIEKVTRELGKKHRVRVATSDGTEQIIILGSGAYRMSAAELYEDVKRVEKEIMEYLKR
jgi:small GTP-binding protein